jgi:hypothetical protein
MIAKSMRYVMMIPLRRCGSNAVRLRLGLHPDVFAPYPVHIHDFFPLLSQYGNLSIDENYQRLIIDVIGFLHTSPLRWSSFSPDPFCVMDTLCREDVQKRSLYRVVYEMYCMGAVQHGARVVLDKSQDSVLEWREWVKTIPDILFLDVVRDPRAQIASMNQCILHDFYTHLNLKTWLHRRGLVEEIRLEYPEKILTVRYEDFVHDPEMFFRTVCGFMSIPYHPAVLDVACSEEAYRMSRTSPLWENNDSQPLESSLHKYEHSLSIAEIGRIERATQEYMHQHHYEMDSPQAFLMEEKVDEEKEENIQQENERRRRKFLEWLRKKFPQDYWMRMGRWRYLKSLHEKKK